MCLIPLVNGRKKLTEDLIVYKVLTMQNASWYRLFKYAPNTTYRIHQKLQSDPDGWYYRGFHAYVAWVFIPPVACITPCRNRKVVKMVIPKGTTVVFGEGGEVVSSTIRSRSLRTVRH